MTVRERVTKILRNIGSMLAGTVHDRLTLQAGVLSRLESELNHVNSTVNDLTSLSQTLAENQGALLQGSSHTIESLQRSQRVFIDQVDILARIEAAIREIRTALAEFKMEANRTANAQLSIFQSRMGQIEQSVHSQMTSLLEGIVDSSSKELGILHHVISNLESSQAAAGSQQLMLQSRMDHIDQSVTSGMGLVLEKIEQLSNNHREVVQGMLTRLDSSERVVSSQQSMLQSRMDEVDKSMKSLADSVLQQFEKASSQHLELIQGLLAKLDSSERAAGSQQSMLRSHMDQVDTSLRSFVDSVRQQIEQASSQHLELIQGLLARLDSSESAAGSHQSMLQSRIDEIGQSVNSNVGSVLEKIDHSSAQQLEVTQRVLARINSSGSAERQAETIKALGNLQNYISERADHLTTAFENEVVKQVCIETSDYRLTNPEIGLISFLYSYLPSRKVIDVGAHVGEFSEALLNIGYEVYAFEPFLGVYEQLVGRLAGRHAFHPFRFALGSSEREMCLHSATDATDSNIYGDATVFSTLKPHGMPDGLQFTGITNVLVRTLDSLHTEGVVPQDVGLVKIDTEGFDLEVIRGMKEHRYPVVAAEFWDSEIPFGKSGLLYTLDSLVGEMRSRGYFWHVVLFRTWGRNQIGYYCNHDRSVPNSWGNVVFFREHALFAQAQMWCSAVLPQTFFKPSANKLHTNTTSHSLA